MFLSPEATSYLIFGVGRRAKGNKTCTQATSFVKCGNGALISDMEKRKICSLQ
jgi:hypothetical protein